MKSIYKIISILLLVLIIEIVAVLNFEKKNKKTILDYYYTLPEYYFFDEDLGNFKYSLYQKDGLWMSKSITDYDLLPIVDLERGYIEINDEGTGGGSTLIKLFLINNSNETPIIAITKGGFNGFYYTSSIKFYKKKHEKWVNASTIFPEFGIEQFLDKDFRSLRPPNDFFIEKNLTLLVQLSPPEMTATITPNFSKFDYLIESNQNTFSNRTLTKGEQETLFHIIDNLSIESFQLEFNDSLEMYKVRDTTLLHNKKAKPKISNEDIIFNKLSDLEVVRNLATYIDSVSQKKRSLALILDDEYQNNSNYYTVKAVEDNGGNYVTHLIFQVQKNNLEVRLYNPAEDKYIKVK